MATKGCIVRRGGTYSVVLSLGRDPSTGKRVQKWYGGHRTRQEAERHLADLLRQLASGGFLPPARESTAAYLHRWLEASRPRLSPKTAERYGELIDQAIAPRIGSLPLRELRPLHLQSLYRVLLESGRLRGKGGLSAQTVLGVHRLLHRALAQAVQDRLLAVNPADAVVAPRPRRAEQPVLDEEGLALLLHSLEGTRLWTPALLAATTGLRRGELLALRWDDVDFQAGALTVCRSLEQTRQGLRFKEPKTRSSRRRISLPGLAIEALLRHRAEQARERLRLGAAYRDNGLVFAEADGRPVEPDPFSAAFHDAAARLGFPRVHLHTLRHTHASQLLRGGVSVTEVSKRLGHATPLVTLTVYAHVLRGEDVEAARLVDRRLRAALAETRKGCRRPAPRQPEQAARPPPGGSPP